MQKVNEIKSGKKRGNRKVFHLEILEAAAEVVSSQFNLIIIMEEKLNLVDSSINNNIKLISSSSIKDQELQ
jgi:Asp-tRNA(Asn)/Glu-tRNA(Gln) amidotransferase C subunit